MRALRPILFAFSILFIVAAAPATAQTAQDRLWDGAIAGDTAAIRQAVSDGASVDSLDTRTSRNGRRALNWAAQYNRADAVSLLLTLKANVEAVNLTGFTPLNHAAENGSLDVAKLLLAAGADPDHANYDGMKPADMARERGHVDVAALIDAAPRKKP